MSYFAGEDSEYLYKRLEAAGIPDASQRGDVHLATTGAQCARG
jgi:hypothetical protein